jgi:hypothetical protein
VHRIPVPCAPSLCVRVPFAEFVPSRRRLPVCRAAVASVCLSIAASKEAAATPLPPSSGLSVDLLVASALIVAHLSQYTAAGTVRNCCACHSGMTCA